MYKSKLVREKWNYVDIFERIRNIRKHRGLTQKEIAEWYHISEASWGRKEKGKEGGFGPAEIELFLQKTHMSSSYLFGETDSLEEADLTKEHKREGVPDLIQKIIDQENAINQMKTMIESKEIDELSLRMSNNSLLRNIIERIFRLDDSILLRIDDYTRGLKDGEQINEKKRDSQIA